MGDILTGTPPELTYLHPFVRDAWMVVWAITSGALAVILGWMGLSFIVQEHLGHHQSGWREMVPRLVLGLTAAASSLWWCALVIDVAHAVSGFIAVSLNVTPGDLLRAPLEPLLAAVETANTGLAVFIALLYLVFGFFVLYLLVQMILRLALIDILLALAPIALGLWILPHTAGWGRHWLRLFMTAVFQQAIQLIAVALAFAFLGEFASIAEFEPSEDLVWKLLMAIAFMYLAGRVPSMLGHHGTFDGLHTLYFGMSLPGGMVRSGRALGLMAGGAAGGPAGMAAATAATSGNQHRCQRGQLGGEQRHAPEPGAVATAGTTTTTGADSFRAGTAQEVEPCASSRPGPTRKRTTNQINFKEERPYGKPDTDHIEPGGHPAGLGGRRWRGLLHLCAASRGIGYPAQSGRTRREFLGQPTHLEAKAEGENSMSAKRLRSECVTRPVPQGPRDTVKAGLPEPQFPVGVGSHPPVERLQPGATHCTGP